MRLDSKMIKKNVVVNFFFIEISKNILFITKGLERETAERKKKNQKYYCIVLNNIFRTCLFFLSSCESNLKFIKNVLKAVIYYTVNNIEGDC